MGNLPSKLCGKSVSPKDVLSNSTPPNGRPDAHSEGPPVTFDFKTRPPPPVGAATALTHSGGHSPAVPIRESCMMSENPPSVPGLALRAPPNDSGVRPTTSFNSLATSQVKEPLAVPAHSTLDNGNSPQVVDVQPNTTFDTAQAQALRGTLAVTNTVTPQISNGQVGSSTGGFFHNASGFVFNNPVMKEIHEHYGPEILEKMTKHIILGAEYNSSYRDDPPKCYPNTRTRFLEELQGRIHDTNLTTRIVWLVGPAGVGKSAIMQSLAEIVCPLPTLRCATLFFSRPNHRDDPKKVFTTLAYGFAVADPEYRRYMGECLIADPLYLDKSLDEQFKRVFILPFTSGRVSSGSQRWVVFLDGLDECNGGKEQNRIVDLIRESTRHHARATPFIWIVASRPEAHLRSSFRRVEEEIKHFWKLEVPIDSEEALHSVEIFLREKFANIRYDYSDLVPPAWPSENDFLVLTKSSSGLFIFASTLVDYVGKEDPIERLERVVSLITRVGNLQDSSNEAKKNPFFALDILYSAIMSGAPLDFLPTTKAILGFYLVGNLLGYKSIVYTGDHKHPLNHVCNVLGIERHNAYAALRNLHSVLDIPSPDDALKKPVKFLHASFSDFLEDRSRSQSYHIDTNQELLNIWRRFADIVRLDSLEGLETTLPELVFGDDSSHSVQKHAKLGSIWLLIDWCHDPSCQHAKGSHHISPGTAEILQLFELLGSSLFTLVQSNLGRPLCPWLSDHAPVALRQQMILKEYNLTQLIEHDLDHIFAGLSRRKWAFYHINDPEEVYWGSKEFNLENLDIDQWNHAKQLALVEKVGWESPGSQLGWKFLANLLTLDKNFGVECTNAKVMIMQMKPMEQCVIIGPLHIPNPNDKDEFFEYLALPYAE